MALDTYANLQTAIADWLNRGDLTSVIPDFITLAETTIRREVMTMDEETNDNTLVTVASQEYVALPADFNKARSLYIDKSPRVALKQVSLATLREEYSEAVGVPAVFAIARGRLYLAPTPNAVFNLDLHYYKFEALSGSVTTNSVLTKHPDLYLRLSLLEAARYLSDRESVAYWNQLAQESLEGIKGYGEEIRSSEDGVIRSPFVY